MPFLGDRYDHFDPPVEVNPICDHCEREVAEVDYGNLCRSCASYEDEDEYTGPTYLECEDYG